MPSAPVVCNMLYIRGQSTFVCLLILFGVFRAGEAIHCYNCRNCPDSTGLLIDCSGVTSSTSCYNTTLLDGSVSRSCGRNDQDRISPEGCVTSTNGITTCRCSTSSCNRCLLSQSPDVNDDAVSPVTSSLRCYNCADCGTSIGISLACPSSRNCYLGKDPAGKISRACGTEELESQQWSMGCESGNGYIFCRCSYSNCNAYSNITAAPSTPRTSTSTTTTTTTSTAAPAIPRVERCYVCDNCGSSFGISLNCPSSRHCYLGKGGTGNVTRACGNDELEKQQWPLGCSIFAGLVFCKCASANCNMYPNMTTTTTTIAATTTTTTAATTTSTTTATSMNTKSIPASVAKIQLLSTATTKLGIQTTVDLQKLNHLNRRFARLPPERIFGATTNLSCNSKPCLLLSFVLLLYVTSSVVLRVSN